MQPNYRDSKQFEEWKEGSENHHPCPNYYEYVQEKERLKEHRISKSVGRMPRGRVSARVYQRFPDYEKKVDTPKKWEREPERDKKQDKRFFVPSDVRKMSYDEPLPRVERDDRIEGRQSLHLKNPLRNIRWTNKKILLVIILATIITNIIGVLLLNGEIFGYPKSFCPLTSLLGIFVTVIGVLSLAQSNRNYMRWDRSEARWVRQWTKGVQMEESAHSFNIGMSATIMGLGMCMMILPLIVLLETIGGTVLFILNMIFAIGMIILLRKYFRFR